LVRWRSFRISPAAQRRSTSGRSATATTKRAPFFAAIGEQGRHYYGYRELPLDMIYRPLYAVSRGLALWWLTMPGRVRAALLPRRWRIALVAIPVVMASLDMIENACIARMLSTWPELSPALVQGREPGHAGEDHGRRADRIVDGGAGGPMAQAADGGRGEHARAERRKLR
jgi:hypothetical protein